MYKFDEEHGNRDLAADAEDNASDTDAVTIVVEELEVISEAAPDADAEAPVAQTPAPDTADRDVPLADEKIDAQFTTQVPEQAQNNEEMMQLRHQAMQKERQLRQQQNQEKMAARRLEMAQAAEAQREELQRLRQSYAQTRAQVQEMQEQIFALHEQIRQLLYEAHQRRIYREGPAR